MSFRTEKYDNYTLIKFSTDKLDAVVSPDLKSELVLINKQGEKNILIDLESVRYCDSSGLSALLIGNRLCNEYKGSFILSSIQPTVAKLLVISQLDSIFKIAKTFDDALGLLTIDEIERNLGVDE